MDGAGAIEEAIGVKKDDEVLYGFGRSAGVCEEIEAVDVGVAGRLIETAEIQHAEGLPPERSFHFLAAIERANRGRVKKLVPAHRSLIGIEIGGSLREKRPVLLQETAELLRRDRLLIDLDV